jgi:hypothetical protein
MSGSSLDLRTASLEQLKVRATTNERDDDDVRGRDGEMRVDARRRGRGGLTKSVRARDVNDRLPMNSCVRR